MTEFVAVHGAFRGSWYWEPLAVELGHRGHQLHAVELSGDSLGAWIGRIVEPVEQRAPDPVVLIGHSMGGVVAQAAIGVLGERVERLVLLDSPLIDPGQRAVDVSGPAPPDDAVLPPRDAVIPPTPVGPEQGFEDPTLREWVNERLAPVPMGPQLDPAPEGTGRPARTSVVFFGRTPDGFPSTFARRRCAAEGIDHVVLDSFHDAPVLQPGAVADVVA